MKPEQSFELMVCKNKRPQQARSLREPQDFAIPKVSLGCSRS